MTNEMEQYINSIYSLYQTDNFDEKNIYGICPDYDVIIALRRNGLLVSTQRGTYGRKNYTQSRVTKKAEKLLKLKVETALCGLHVKRVLMRSKSDLNIDN